MQKSTERQTKPVSPSRFLALALLWGFLTLLLLVYVLRQYSLIVGAADNLTYYWDFKLFYAGSLDFWSGGSLYKPSAVLPFERIIDKNGNSPVGGLLFLLLSQLPLSLAAGCWVILSLVVFYASLSLVWRVYPLPRQWHWRAAIILFIFISYPVLDTLQVGGWGMIIASLDFAAWYYARKGREGRAGVLLGLALSIRWQPFVIFLYFLSMRRWRLIFASLLTALLAYLVALLVFGLHNFIDFANLAFRLTGDNTKLSDPYDGSFRGFLGRISDLLKGAGLNFEGWLPFIWLCGALVLIGCTLWRCRSLSYDYAFSLCIVTGLLLAPSSWMHYHMALLLPMTLLFQHRQYWPLAYIALLWLSVYHLFPFGPPLEFRDNPLLFGSLLSFSLFLLYFYLFRGTRAADDTAYKAISQKS
jgi:hypothetical protein